MFLHVILVEANSSFERMTVLRSSGVTIMVVGARFERLVPEPVFAFVKEYIHDTGRFVPLIANECGEGGRRALEECGCRVRRNNCDSWELAKRGWCDVAFLRYPLIQTANLCLDRQYALRVSESDAVPNAMNECEGDHGPLCLGRFSLLVECRGWAETWK